MRCICQKGQRRVQQGVMDKKLLSTWRELLLRKRPTHLIKHELLLEGSIEKNQVSINIAQGKGSKVGSGGKILKYLVAIS